MSIFDDQSWDSEEEFYGDASGDLFFPRDPGKLWAPDRHERKAYRDEMTRMAKELQAGYFGWKTDEHGNVTQEGFADALGTTGGGSGYDWGSYEDAKVKWNKWGNYQPQSTMRLSSWGWNYGYKPFPILQGAIVTPTIDIFARKADQHFDESGRELWNDRPNIEAHFVGANDVLSGIVKSAGSRAQAELERLMRQGMPMGEAGLLAEKTAMQSVRNQLQPFGRADFGERWNMPYAARVATANSVQIRMNLDYDLGPNELFQRVGSMGYFPRSTRASIEPDHPDRGAFPAYSFDSLYALGWLKGPNGSFITDTNKPAKRRQLGVQRLAALMGASDMGRGRLSGDRLMRTTAVFMDNYPYSEGSGVADPLLATGFRDFRPQSIKRPMNAGEEWQVRFNVAEGSEQTKRKWGHKWHVFDTQQHMGSPGESVFIGEQFVKGKWEPLQQLPGIEGVRQGIWGYRKTSAGYHVLTERQFPFESGSAKIMHYGLKALLFKSGSIIRDMQSKVRSAVAAGVLPQDVGDPRLVLPMSKGWMQTYMGMFDVLPADTLRGMGISDKVIKNRDWQQVGPQVIDKLSAFANERKFSFEMQHEMPLTRAGAFTNVNNAKDMSIFERGGKQWTRFTSSHTGFVLPIAVGMRMEYPGKVPRNSPEELMQMGVTMPGFVGRLLRKANASSRIWGVAAAAQEGTVPEGAIGYETLPWATARLNEEGQLNPDGDFHSLMSGLLRELKVEGRHKSAIVGPGGVLMPSVADMMGRSIRSLSGDEQSTFFASYGRAMRLMNLGEDPTEALAEFSGELQEYAKGHKVRREATGVRLRRGVEGVFTSHYAIPDDVAVVGNDRIRQMAGIKPNDPDAEQKLSAFVNALESGQDPFYVLGTRRPVSSMFDQLAVPMRMVTERMAQEQYGVPIEDLGRNFAVSPTVASLWRGDVDADRALLQAATRVQFNDQVTRIRTENVNVPTGEMGDIPAGLRKAFGNTGYGSLGLMKMRALPSEEVWREAGATFSTPREIMQMASSQSLMQRQLLALQRNATEQYKSYMSSLSPAKAAALTAGLAGSRSATSTLAMSEALHGIDVDWNESKKWSDSLISEEEAMRRVRAGDGSWLKSMEKNRPHDLAWYSDPSHGTVFTREQMLGDFQRAAKSKMLMGRGYNRYLRSMTALAQSPEELQAAIAMASGIYQKALDNQQMTRGELMLFNMMESVGPSGAMFDKFYTEKDWIDKSHAGGPIGIMAGLADNIMDVDAPAWARATLFSRDPAIRSVVEKAIESGSSYDILRAIGKDVGQGPGAEAFLGNTSRAGILPQLVQAMHYSKGSMRDKGNLSDYMRNYTSMGDELRAMVRVLSKSEEGGLPLGSYTKRQGGKDIEMPGAIQDIRSMRGLSSLPRWQRAMAGRMGLGEAFFAGPEALASILGIPGRAVGGPVDEDQPYVVGEEGPEIFVPKTAGDIVKLPKDLQSRIRNAADPKAEFARVASELQEKISQGRVSEQPSPTASNGFTDEQRRIAAEALEWARQHRADRERATGMSGSTPWVVEGWEGTVDQAMVRRMFADATGSTPGQSSTPDPASSGAETRAEEVSRKRVVRNSLGGNMRQRLQATKQLMGQLGRGQPLEGADDIVNAVNYWREQMAGAGYHNVPAELLPLLQMMTPEGSTMMLSGTSYGPDNFTIKASWKQQGLSAVAAGLADDFVKEGLTEGNTSEFRGTAREVYANKALGPSYVRSMRNLMGANMDTLNMKSAWRLWDDTQRLEGAFASREQMPQVLATRMEKLDQTMQRLTEVETKRAEQTRQILDGDPRMRNAEAAIGALRPGQALSDDERRQVSALRNVREMAGMRTDDLDNILHGGNLQSMLDLASGPQRRSGIIGRIRDTLEQAPGRRQQSMGMIGGSLGALNFGMWGAQMWWRWTGQPLLNWTQQFAGQQMDASQAAYLTGGSSALAGAPQELLYRSALMANTRLDMGRAAYNVWGKPVTSLVEGIAGMPEGRQEDIAKALGIFGVAGVQQTMMSTLGMLTGVPALGQLGAFRLASSGAHLVGQGAQWAGMQLLTHPATSGAVGTALGLGAKFVAPALGYAGAATMMASGASPDLYQSFAEKAPEEARGAIEQAAFRGLLIQGNYPDWKMAEMYGSNWKSGGYYDISSGTPRRMGATGPEMSKDQAWQAFQAEMQWYGGSSVLDLYGGGKTFGAVGMTTSDVTDLARKGEKIGISIEEGTVVIRSLAGLTGQAVSENLFMAAANQSRMNSGGMSSVLQSYNTILNQAGAVPGAPNVAGLIQGMTSLNETQLAQRQAAMGIVGQYASMSWTPEDFVNRAAFVQQSLASGTPMGVASTQFGAMTGKLGIARAMNIPSSSPIAGGLEYALAGSASPILQPNQVDPFAQSLSQNWGMFRYMNQAQKGELGPGLAKMWLDWQNGNMSDWQFTRGIESATGSTPWGYSSQRGFGPGSLTDELGDPYGMYTGDPGSATWTASYGRQAGAQFAPLFDLQMNASYASLGYASAANEAQSRQFARQQAQLRREWGSGTFQPLAAVQAAMYPTDGSVAAEPGSGMSVGGSAIGFAQQEATIRRQMWQESIAAQQQSIQFARQGLELARQGLEISRQELALSKQQYGIQREYKLSEQQAQRGMQLRQYEWSAEDYAIKVERTGITQQWAMEDLERARRYATGRERVQIERQIQRTQITQGWEQDDTTRGRDRELEVQRYQDQRYEAAVAFEQKLHDIQMERFDLQERRLNLQSAQLDLQEAQLAAQEARLNTNIKLQEDMNKLEDERFKAQYEQMQAQMEDDQKLEVLRKAARDAEIAYQAAQLANVETITKIQREFKDELEKAGGANGVLDKWIDFFNAIHKGPPTGKKEGENNNNSSGSGSNSAGQNQPFGTEPTRSVATVNPIQGQQSVTPTVVNFVLDGEVIMSAVVKPERLRPIVQEIQRRDSWR